MIADMENVEWAGGRDFLYRDKVEGLYIFAEEAGLLKRLASEPWPSTPIRIQPFKVSENQSIIRECGARSRSRSLNTCESASACGWISGRSAANASACIALMLNAFRRLR